jgi:hypothetical protein
MDMVHSWVTMKIGFQDRDTGRGMSASLGSIEGVGEAFAKKDAR